MKTRFKHRHMPGDVPKRYKIEMLEEGESSIKFSKTHTQLMGRKCAKSFKKMKLMRERAVLKERTRKIIRDEQ